MSDFGIALLAYYSWICGVLVGYIIWAPETPFKKGFVDGLSLKFLWGRK
jgi:hypothetical protein